MCDILFRLSILGALAAMILGITPSAADAPHLGAKIASVFEDNSGDSGYQPFGWCGDLLWVGDSHGSALVDPKTRMKVWHSLDTAGQSFLGCQHVDGHPILWTDAYPDSVAWRIVGDNRIGVVQNIRRDFCGQPFIRFTDRTVAVFSAQETVRVINSPPGLSVVSVQRDQILEADLVCLRDSTVHRTQYDDRLRLRDSFFIRALKSPSGRWVAWTEWSSEQGFGDGDAALYLAPTADVLKP
jgi:hypothetical protein